MGAKIDSAFIGSCTNGRYEDIKAAAGILEGKKIAPGVVLKIVPATREIWERCLEEDLVKILMDAGADFNVGRTGRAMIGTRGRSDGRARCIKTSSDGREKT